MTSTGDNERQIGETVGIKKNEISNEKNEITTTPTNTHYRRWSRRRSPTLSPWPQARPRVFPGWQTAPGGRQVSIWPCAGHVGARRRQRRLSVEAPGARAQRGSWASCAPQPLASGPKHGQGCSQAGRRRQVGVRWRFGLVRARWRPECPHFGFCRWRRAGHLCDLPALGGPGQGQGYAGARVRVTFRWIGTVARSLDPILLHPGKSWILTSRE